MAGTTVGHGRRLCHPCRRTCTVECSRRYVSRSDSRFRTRSHLRKHPPPGKRSCQPRRRWLAKIECLQLKSIGCVLGAIRLRGEINTVTTNHSGPSRSAFWRSLCQWIDIRVTHSVRSGNSKPAAGTSH